MATRISLKLYVRTSGLYKIDGTPRGAKNVNRRQGIGGYQRNVTRNNSLHNTALHWLDAAINEAREADPTFRVSSPAVRKAKAALKAHVKKLHVVLPHCERLRYFVGAEDQLLSTTRECFDRNADDVHDRRFFMYAGQKVGKDGRPLYERRPLKGGKPWEDPSGKLVYPPVSPLQTLRILFPIPANLLFQKMLEDAEHHGAEIYKDCQDVVLTWADDFQRDELPRFVEEWTGEVDEDNYVPLSAAELVEAAQHWDTKLPHIEVGLSELREISREEALEKKMPIDKPFGKSLLKKLLGYDLDLPRRLKGRAFVLCGKPQLGRQGPDMVGLHLQKRAGWELLPEDQAHYDSKLYRGKERRKYGGIGLGIDTDLNDRFYTYCKQKAESLGMAEEWEAAEAAYREWLREAVVLKRDLEAAKRLAQLHFDMEQAEKGKAIRKAEVESTRVQLQAELRDAGFGSKELNELALVHPLRKIVEKILDGWTLDGELLTLGKLGRLAREGLSKLIAFLTRLFEDGFPSRTGMPAPDEDPDVWAIIERRVAEEASKLKPIIVERVLERRVKLSADQQRWRDRRFWLSQDQSLREKAPLVVEACRDEAVGLLNWKEPKWFGKKVAWNEQIAIVDDMIDQVNAEYDTEQARLLAIKAKQDADDAAAKENALKTAMIIAEHGTVVGAFKDSETSEQTAQRVAAERTAQDTATRARNAVVNRLRDKAGDLHHQFEEHILFAAAGVILSDTQIGPAARETRVVRLMRSLSAGFEKSGRWQPADLVTVVIVDRASPFDLSPHGKAERELEIGMG